MSTEPREQSDWSPCIYAMTISDQFQRCNSFHNTCLFCRCLERGFFALLFAAVGGWDGDGWSTDVVVIPEDVEATGAASTTSTVASSLVVEDAVWGSCEQGCQMAKFDPFLSLDCTMVEGVGGAIREKEGIKYCSVA